MAVGNPNQHQVPQLSRRPHQAAAEVVFRNKLRPEKRPRTSEISKPISDYSLEARRTLLTPGCCDSSGVPDLCSSLALSSFRNRRILLLPRILSRRIKIREHTLFYLYSFSWHYRLLRSPQVEERTENV